jgi:hypothetical protein
MGEASPGGDTASEELLIVRRLNQVSGSGGTVPNPQDVARRRARWFTLR